VSTLLSESDSSSLELPSESFGTGWDSISGKVQLRLDVSNTFHEDCCMASKMIRLEVRGDGLVFTSDMKVVGPVFDTMTITTQAEQLAMFRKVHDVLTWTNSFVSNWETRWREMSDAAKLQCLQGVQDVSRAPVQNAVSSHAFAAEVVGCVDFKAVIANERYKFTHKVRTLFNQIVAVAVKRGFIAAGDVYRSEHGPDQAPSQLSTACLRKIVTFTTSLVGLRVSSAAAEFKTIRNKLCHALRQRESRRARPTVSAKQGRKGAKSTRKGKRQSLAAL
jgi:hypothetical protein